MMSEPALVAAGFTAGVDFVINALLETSVLGSGVGWANNVAAVRTPRAAIGFMAPMLTTRSGGLQTAVFLLGGTRFAPPPKRLGAQEAASHFHPTRHSRQWDAQKHIPPKLARRFRNRRSLEENQITPPRAGILDCTSRRTGESFTTFSRS